MESNKLIRAVLFILVIIPAVAGCYTWQSRPYEPGIPPEALASLDAAVERHALGNSEAFASTLEALVTKYPFFVEAHRHLQNLYLQDFRNGYLLNHYGAMLEREPDRPACNYLYGRILSEPSSQVKAFTRSVELDRGFFWGYNGLGFALTQSGDYKDSELAYLQAIRSSPGQVEPYIGLITIYLARNHHEEAERLLRRAEKLFPDDLSIALLRCRYIADREGPRAALEAQVNLPFSMDPGGEFFTFMLNLLDRAASDRLERRILYRFGPASSPGDGNSVARNLVLGLCLRRCGDLRGASRYFHRVLDTLPANARARRELRYIYCMTGRIRDAYALQIADCPESWIKGSRYPLLASRLFDLGDRLAAQVDWSGLGAEALDLADILIELGWLEESTFYLHRAAELAGESGKKAARRLEEIYRHMSFELKLYDYFIKQYADFAADGISTDLDDALEELSLISIEILGQDLFKDVVEMDFWPAGVLVDPRRAVRCGPARYFERFNRFFLMGQKRGGPVEAYLLDIFDYQSLAAAPVAGVELPFDLIRCENLRIPSYIEYGGGNIAGAALHSFVFINLDAVRLEVQEGRRLYERFKNREALLLNDPPPRAASEDEVLDVSEPMGLAQRLKYLSYKKRGAAAGDSAYMADRFETLMAHEAQHLVDARKFLPFWPNLLSNLYHFAALGLSAFRVESWLEERSQLHSLLRSEDAYAALAVTASHLGSGPIRTPHQRGYRDLLKRIVEYIYEEEDRFPVIDRTANILHQLYLLTEEEIREIAQALAEEEELSRVATPPPAAG